MRVVRAGHVSAVPGPAEKFDGAVWAETPIEATDAMPLILARVSFAPGARTAWHTHPRGQLLLATAGIGRVQRDNGPVVEMRPGDVIAIEPGERHWHGAAHNHAFEHVEIHGVDDNGHGAVRAELVRRNEPD